MYHTEGAGGGHAPDILAVNGWENVIPSSTNPTNPFTAAALEEGVPMTMLAHMMSYELPEDVSFAECRIRPQTMAAEDMLHDIGTRAGRSEEEVGRMRVLGMREGRGVGGRTGGGGLELKSRFPLATEPLL